MEGLQSRLACRGGPTAGLHDAAPYNPHHHPLSSRPQVKNPAAVARQRKHPTRRFAHSTGSMMIHTHGEGCLDSRSAAGAGLVMRTHQRTRHFRPSRLQLAASSSWDPFVGDSWWQLVRGVVQAERSTTGSSSATVTAGFAMLPSCTSRGREALSSKRPSLESRSMVRGSGLGGDRRCGLRPVVVAASRHGCCSLVVGSSMMKVMRSAVGSTAGTSSCRALGVNYEAAPDAAGLKLSPAGDGDHEDGSGMGGRGTASERTSTVGGVSALHDVALANGQPTAYHESADSLLAAAGTSPTGANSMRLHGSEDAVNASTSVIGSADIIGIGNADVGVGNADIGMNAETTGHEAHGSCSAKLTEGIRGTSGGQMGKSAKKFIVDNFLLLSIATGVLFATLFPLAGQFANHQLGLTHFCTFAIFVISGLVLDTRELAQIKTSWETFAFGLASILFLTPLAALVVLRLPLRPIDLRTGLALFCCMPCTITAGISLVRAAGANTAVALALTVITNTAGIITMPLVLSWLVQGGSGVSLPAGALLRALVSTLLLPLIFGMVLRRTIPEVASWADGHRQHLSMANNSLLSLVPWMQVSCSQSALKQLSPLALLPVAIAGVVTHICFLAFNVAATRLIRKAAASRCSESIEDSRNVDRAVIILASQKTLPVAATVVNNLGSVLGSPALILLPCIMTHFLQIFIDTLVVSKWLNDDRRDMLKTT